MSDLRSLLRLLGQCGKAARDAVLDSLAARDLRALEEEWSWQALPGQGEPPGEWRTWLILAGRGFGKTRAGAEWVLERARRVPDARIALVGASLDEVAKVMVQGESGLMACAQTGERLQWRPSLGKVDFPSGAQAIAYSGASPAGLRGPQHQFAWADEIAKWQRPEASWDNLQMGLRLGDAPQAVVTTTPLPIPLLGRLMAESGTRVTRGRTFDNPHLPATFVEAMRSLYGGTRLGRQELEGQLLSEAEGALWSRAVIEACRIERPPDEALARVVVGVDPPAGDKGDRCGIVVCARLSDGRGVVLADCSVGGLRPEGWARAVAAAAASWGADRVVAESNNGGLMVESVLRTVAPGLPLKLVHASRGKSARAEPVAAAFEARRCGLAGHFPELEDELTAITAGGYSGGGSPDRADAMVWALSELLLGRVNVPRVRGL